MSRLLLTFVLLILHKNQYGVIATIDLSGLPFFGTTTSTFRPIVIIEPRPPYSHGYHGQQNGQHNGYGHYSTNYVLVIEKTEVPYMNNNFFENIQYQIQRLTGQLSAGVGTVQVRRYIHNVTLAIKVYSCNEHHCTTLIQAHPRQSFCHYMNQHHYYPGQCGAGYEAGGGPHGCALNQGTYSFSTYIPLNILPEEIPGARWRMDCYMAQLGKRIATFSLYSRCAPITGIYTGNHNPVQYGTGIPYGNIGGGVAGNFPFGSIGQLPLDNRPSGAGPQTFPNIGNVGANLGNVPNLVNGPNLQDLPNYQNPLNLDLRDQPNPMFPPT